MKIRERRDRAVGNEQLVTVVSEPLAKRRVSVRPLLSAASLGLAICELISLNTALAPSRPANSIFLSDYKLASGDSTVSSL